MQLTGAEIVIRCLQEEGVDYVFGYPGGAVLNIYDELFKQEKVKHVLVRHEQGAVHAADGYSRSSQKIGVALVTSGPGVTNAVTGLATTVKKAFYLAGTGRPGPVVVDIPKDVTQATTEFSYPKTISLRSYNPVTKGPAAQLKKGGELPL